MNLIFCEPEGFIVWVFCMSVAKWLNSSKMSPTFRFHLHVENVYTHITYQDLQRSSMVSWPKPNRKPFWISCQIWLYFLPFTGFILQWTETFVTSLHIVQISHPLSESRPEDIFRPRLNLCQHAWTSEDPLSCNKCYLLLIILPLIFVPFQGLSITTKWEENPF